MLCDGTPWKEAQRIQTALLIHVGHWPIACRLLFDILRQVLAALKKVSASFCLKRGHLKKMTTLGAASKLSLLCETASFG